MMDSFVGLSLEEFKAKIIEHNSHRQWCPHCFCWLIITAGPAMEQCCLCGALKPTIAVIHGMIRN